MKLGSSQADMTHCPQQMLRQFPTLTTLPHRSLTPVMLVQQLYRLVQIQCSVFQCVTVAVMSVAVSQREMGSGTQ